MRRILLFVITCSFFFSCAQKDPLALKTREVDYLDKTGDVVKANMLDVDVMGIQDIVVYDSLLLVITNDPLVGMLQVYNKNSLEHLASLCHNGRARNEFAGEVFLVNRQFYVNDNGDLILPLLDNKTLIQKEVNVSVSLREGHTVVSNVESRSDDCFNSVLLDNGLEKSFTCRQPYVNPQLDETTLPVFAIKEQNEIIKEIKVFRKHVNTEDPVLLQACYRGDFIKHPNRNLVVMTMGGMDYLLFFDIDNDNYFAIHQTGRPSAQDICFYKDRDKNRSCFGGPLVDYSSDRFMVFYFGGRCTEEAVREGVMRGELMLFDWDGNYLGGVKMDTNFLSASYDPETMRLYAADTIEDKIFTFDLSPLMKSIDK